MAQPTSVGSDPSLDVTASPSSVAAGWQGDRRRFLGLTGSVAAAGLVLSTSCFGGGSDESTPTSTAAASETAAATRRGGTLRMGQSGDLSLSAGHPFALVSQNRILFYAVSETLVGYGASLTPVPVLAERFEVSADFRRVSATLKAGVQFHNGAPVTTDDVAFSVQTLQNPASAGLPGALQFELTPVARSIADIRVVDARTIEFTFDSPRTNAADFFTQLPIAQRTSFKEIAQGNVVGSGPFQLKQWDRNRGYRLERFANWHGAGSDGKPYLDAIEVSIVPDQTAAMIAFRGGNLDAYLAMSAPNAVQLRGSGQTRLTGKTGMSYLGVNVTNPLVQDRRVRQAIFYAVNRDRMVRDAGQGFGSVTTQPWASTSPAFDPSREAPFYDLPRARALLSQAGFQQDRELAIEYPAGIPLQELQAQLLQSDLQAAGIDTRLEAIDGARFTQRYRAREFPDFWLASHLSGDFTPLTLLQQAFEFRATGNASSFEDSTYAALVRRLETLAPASADAKDVYRQINQLMLENPFVIPTGIPQVRIDLVQDSVLGWPAAPADYSIAPSGKVDFARISLR